MRRPAGTREALGLSPLVFRLIADKMPKTLTAASAQHGQMTLTPDDIVTICAISVFAGIVTNILHEGVGHGTTALLTGASSGVLTTVAWSSAFDSRLVEAGGTLVNLAAALVFWLALRRAKHGSVYICRNASKPSDCAKFPIQD